jgi:type II secretory pathway pseudopilin PulG
MECERMNTRNSSGIGDQGRDGQDGFTLLEMVIAVILLILITAAIGAALTSSLNATSATKTRVDETNDAQFIAGFFTRDAQAAGGIDPSTGSANPNLGVTAPAANGCSAPGPSGSDVSIIGFEWIDQASGTTNESNYSYVTTTFTAGGVTYQPQELLRTVCSTSAATATSVLAKDIVTSGQTPLAGCNTPTSACPSGVSHPPTTTTVYMTVTAYKNSSSNPTKPYTFTLSASLRPQSSRPAVPITTSAFAPLLALGGVGCTNGTTGFDDGGTSNPVTVYGGTNINATDSGGCPAMYVHGNTYPATQPVSIVSGGTCSGCTTPPGTYTTGIVDPYQSLKPLAAMCTGGSNPSGSSFNAGGTPLVFPQPYAAGNVSFAAGTYVFCQGLSAGHITTPPLPQPGVVFYIVAGGFATSGNANVAINGVLYAPTSVVNISGNGTFLASSVVAGAVVVQGTTSVTIGIPPAVNAISLSNPSGGGSYLAGTNLYYRGAVAGSFTLTNALTDAGGPGAASSTFAALGGTSTGWTHVASTVSSPVGGPYVSTPFSWVAGTTSSPTEVVTGTDSFGFPNAGTTLTLTNDSTAPTGGALTVNGTAATAGGSTSSSAITNFTIGTRNDYNADAGGSGVASSTLTVRSETLTAGTCGAPGSGGPFTAPTTISGTTQPAGIVKGFCYLYTLTGTDNVGNSTNLTTTVKVPLVALTVSPVRGPAGTTGVTLSGTGYNAGATVNATTGVTFGGAPLTISGTQTVAANGTWSATFTVPSGSFGPKTITATDSGGASASTTFTLGFAGIDWAGAVSTGTIGACDYSTITAVTCTATGAGNKGTFQASVKLIDAAHNAVNNPTGATITVTQVTTGQGTTTTTAPVTILNGASTTAGNFTLTLNNGANKTATITASITVNAVTYTVSLTLSN